MSQPVVPLSLEDQVPNRTSQPAAARRRLVGIGLLTLALTAVLLVLGGTELSREFSRAAKLRTDVRQSYEARSQIQRVFSLLQDAETGQRGYVITGQEAYLEPYNTAVDRLDDQLGALGDMLAHQPAQLRDFQILLALVEQKRVTLRSGISTRRDLGASAAVELVAAGAGKAIMDDIRRVIDRITAREAEALNALSKRADARTNRTELIVIILFTALVFLAGGASLLVWRYFQTREALMARIEASAARRRAIFDSTIDAIITLNPSGSIETANPAAERMFGYSKSELERRDISLLVDLAGQGEGSFLARMGGSDNLASGVTREGLGRRADGESFPVDIALGPMELPSGRHTVAVIRDITERRRTERMKDEFVSTVSHELRTPLTSIAGSLGLLEGGAAGPIPEKAARLISIANTNSQRLVRLINDILDVEKLQSGQLTLNMGSVDLRDIAERSIDSVRGYADKLGIWLEFHPGEKAPVFGDEDRLIQVATNLLSNAIKFSPTGSTVDVTVSVRGRSARLSVADKGPGIPEDFRGRIFGKFAQADASETRAKGGTGLGLAISRELTQRHGGKLWFESAQGEGATFHLDLPLDGAETIDKVSDGPRILICEDDPDAASVLCAMLEAEGFRADVATTAGQALLMAKGRDYVAALVDLNLPDANGVSLIRAMWSGAGPKSLPVVVVSGDIKSGKARAGSLPICDWMEKPFDQKRLQQALEAVRQEGQRPLVLHVDDDRDILAVVRAALSERAEIAPAASLKAARAFLARQRPDLVILDLGLPDGSGLELLADIGEAKGPAVPVVIYSAQDADLASTAAVDAVLTKSRMSLNELAQTVRRLTAKET